MEEAESDVIWHDQWARLDETERWCIEFATILRPGPIPTHWLQALVRRLLSKGAKPALSIRNVEADAIDHLSETGWLQYVTDDFSTVQVAEEVRHLREGRLRDSHARQAVCANIISALGIERAKAVRRVDDQRIDEREILFLLQVARTLRGIRHRPRDTRTRHSAGPPEHATATWICSSGTHGTESIAGWIG